MCDNYEKALCSAVEELRRAELLLMAEVAKTKLLIKKAWRVQQRADLLVRTAEPQQRPAAQHP